MRIHLPAETWEEILNWLNRLDFAQKMEQLWDREFTQIAHNWLHKWHRNVCIGRDKLEFVAKEVKDIDKNGQTEKQACCLLKCIRRANGSQSYEKVPIAVVELPGNITNFHSIQVSYLDPTVMKFLHQMRPILSRIHLLIGPIEPGNQTALDFLLPTITGPLESLSICNEESLRLFKDYFPTVLANAKMLWYCSTPSSVSEWMLQCLTNWLFSPCEEGQPRKFLLSLATWDHYNPLITEIRKRFSIPNRRSCSFFIKVDFWRNAGIEDSFNENIAMGEQLTVRGQRRATGDVDVLISCHSNNEDKERIAKEEQELLDWDLRNISRKISVWNPKIGQGINADVNNIGEKKPGPSQQQASGSQLDGQEEASTKPDEED